MFKKLKKKSKFAIVNRSFGLDSQVIGESLLQLAELLACSNGVVVICQSSIRMQEQLTNARRGRGVQIMACRSHSDSSAKIIRRVFDALVFMLWTFFCLIRKRPEVVYVSTNPPLVVPFIVLVYSKLFGARYCYHLQDIHPEAANIVVKLNPLSFKTLQWLDDRVMRNADSLITLSEDMKNCILSRSKTNVPIHLLDNPAFDAQTIDFSLRVKDFVYCGNAGRLQRIPLLLDAIAEYLDQGGGLNFCFVGAGIFAPQIQQLALSYHKVRYLGYLPHQQAAEIVSQHRWALLPIDDEVTRYAFPSKSSSYVMSDCRILAICGQETSVAHWVYDNGIGLVCSPTKSEIVSTLQRIESGDNLNYDVDKQKLKHKLTIGYYVKKIAEIMDT